MGEFTHRFVLSNLQRILLFHMEITVDRKVRFIMTNATKQSHQKETTAGEGQAGT